MHPNQFPGITCTSWFSLLSSLYVEAFVQILRAGYNKTLKDVICTFDLNHIWLPLLHYSFSIEQMLPVCLWRARNWSLLGKSQWRGSQGLCWGEGGAAQCLRLSPTNDPDCFRIRSVSTAPNRIIKTCLRSKRGPAVLTRDVKRPAGLFCSS